MLRIKTLRLENDLSQSALAQKIGSSQKAVDFWEKGRSEPSARFVIAMADCFKCTTDYLLGREDDFGNVNVESDLNENEKTILEFYRSLDKNKKQELISFAKFLNTQNE